ncbi:hypothetical protein P168DRAFT_190168 [Aspergillus campestris IBT 28561]|uniref:Uncharacterized protein n=1 Tax=Aspergillus campestris (strain IBT 28561) TaxID=1392248 RepID=A0A2I1CYK5_ASPC2|nr:uncharacterized protein P168DRAFT_190168 [Aspergillus campestris IBT 28561]PKY02702.1 hypothetical protein P168DRAFT_190168 [Aspergillus campestris IBT 28561]
MHACLVININHTIETFVLGFCFGFGCFSFFSFICYLLIRFYFIFLHIFRSTHYLILFDLFLFNIPNNLPHSFRDKVPVWRLYSARVYSARSISNDNDSFFPNQPTYNPFTD